MSGCSAIESDIDELNSYSNLLKNLKKLRGLLNGDGLQRDQKEAFMKHLNEAISRILLLYISSQDQENIETHENKESADTLRSVIPVFIESAKDKQFPPLGLNQIVLSLYNSLDQIQCDKIKNSVAQLCEIWWDQKFDGKNAVIRNVIFFLLKRALDKQMKSDIRRVIKLIEYLKTVELEEEEIIIIIKCTTSNFMLSVSEGRKLISSFFMLSSSFIPNLQTAVKIKLTEYNDARAYAYGEVYYNAWRLSFEDEIHTEIEDKCIQDFMFHCLYASKECLARILRKVLGYIHQFKNQKVVGEMLLRLYRPILWRSLKVANASVRSNAAVLFFILFPLIDLNAKRMEIDEEMEKQLLVATDLLNDDFPNVRTIAIEGVCRLCNEHWESFDSAKLKLLLNPLVESLAFDSSSVMVRVAVFKGFSNLLNNVMCHGVMKVLLRPLEKCLFDVSESVCVAFLDMLLSLKGRRTFKFWEIVSADKLLMRLENCSSNVGKRIVILLMDAYHPRGKGDSLLIKRSMKLITEYPAVYYNFYLELARILNLNEIVYYMLVVHSYLKGFCNNVISKAVEGGELDLYVDPNASDEDVECEIEEMESYDYTLDLSVIKRLLEVVCIMWMTKKRDLEILTEEQRTLSALQSRYAMSMTKFFKVFRNTEAFQPLIYLCGFLPASKVQNAVSYCIAKVKSLPSDATEEIYAHMLESLCSWNRGDELLEIIIYWTETGFSFSSESNKKGRIGRTVRFEEPFEPRPNLGLQMLSYVLKSTMCRRSILNNFRSELEELLGVLNKSRNLLHAVVKNELSEDHVSVDFLQRAFFLTFELSMHLHNKSGESTVNVIDYLSKLLIWAEDSVLTNITNCSGNNSSDSTLNSSIRFRSHNKVESSVNRISSNIILSILKQLSVALLANVCDMNLTSQIAHFLTVILSNELLTSKKESDGLIIYALRVIWRLEEYCLAINKEDNDTCLAFIPDVFKAFINTLAEYSNGFQDSLFNMGESLKVPMRELLQNFQRYTFLSKGINDVMKVIVNVSLTELSAKHSEDFVEDQINSLLPLTSFLWSHISSQSILLNNYLEELKRSVDSLNVETPADVAAVISIMHCIKKKRKSHGAITKEIIFCLEEKIKQSPNLNVEHITIIKSSISKLKTAFDLVTIKVCYKDMEKARRPREKVKKKDKEKRKTKVNDDENMVVGYEIEASTSHPKESSTTQPEVGDRNSPLPLDNEIAENTAIGSCAIINEACFDGNEAIENRTISLDETSESNFQIDQSICSNDLTETFVNETEPTLSQPNNVEQLKVSEISSAKPVDYLALRTELVNLEIIQDGIPEYVASAPLITELEISPSVPTSSELLSEEVDNVSTEVVNKQKESVVHRKIVARIATAESEMTVRPFLESQLKSLYYNQELECNDLYVNHFIESYRCFDSHEFFELVASYQKNRLELLSTMNLFDELKHSYDFKVDQVWTSVTQVTKAQKKCRDGINVVGSYEYRKAVFNENTSEELKSLLLAIQTAVNETYALHAYKVELSKSQVDSYIYRLLSTSTILAAIPRNAPVQVYFPDMRPSELVTHVEKLKCCISILFSFQRQSLKDKQFIFDSRQWLTKLVAVLLRVGTFEDHLFIMNHVMRCPAGISNWAASFIQIPPPVNVTGPYPIGGPFLDHVITIMATVLLPVRAREEFLQNIKLEMSANVSSDDNDNKWVLVDSEGEEDEDPKNCWLHLRESDLIAVVNQIPIGCLFKHLLGVFTIDDKDYYDNRYMTDQEMMRVFSVATQLVRLFRESFKTYHLSRYKQFTKRVSQFIRHLVINITDHLQAFLMSYSDFPLVIRSRLLVEYDQFFLRSAYSIFSSQRKGAWQFMAAMPYTTVSVEMLWKILWLLHNDYAEDLETIEQELSACGWQKKLSDQHLHLKFEERLLSLPENEVYFLLTAFANMATSRGAQDRSFIETVCGEVFQISFVNEASKNMCFKWGRELLCNMASKHQFIMSVLMQEVSLNMEKLGKAAMYLFQELPLNLWQPKEEDIAIIIMWLKKFSPSTTENQLSQMILSQMNWELNDEEDELWLDISIHRQVLIAVWESYQLYISSAKCGPIYEGIKQITSIAAALKSGESPDNVFRSWSWKMLRTLKVHVHDIQVNTVPLLSNMLPYPNLLEDPSLQNLRWSVRDRHPFSIAVALRMTNIGHGIAEVCQNMDYFQSLMEQQYFECVIDLLFSITPLFFNCGHYLWTNKTFVTVIQNLLVCDITYLKMAKSIVVSTFPGSFLKLLSSMIEGQLQRSTKMNWSPEVIVSFWTETLTAIPNWFKIESVLYLLDNVLMSTFMNNKELSYTILSKRFQQLLGQSGRKNEASHQGAASTFSSLFSWVTTGSGIPFTFISKDMPKQYPWLTYALLELETQTDRETKLWKYVLKELVANSSSTPELALKKAAGLESAIVSPVHHLPIYRWSSAVVDLNNDCPLMPLFWQKFFNYYLQRPNHSSGNGITEGVGQRFFSQMNDLYILKKMKQKLQLLVAHHEKLKTAATPTEESDSAEEISLSLETKEWELRRSKEMFHGNLLKLYRTMSLWLEEPQLHEHNLYFPALLAEYDPLRLNAIIVQNSKEPWLEFLDINVICRCSVELHRLWYERLFIKNSRKKYHSKTDGVDVYSTGGVDAILKRLRSYEEPVSPPLVATLKPVVQEVPSNLFDSERNALEGIGSYFSVLTDFAKTYSNRLANHVALDCNYLELMPQIYQNVETEVQLSVACQKGQSTFSLSSDSGCLGPAAIKLKFFEMKEISSVKNLVDQNRAEWLALINESFLGPSQNLSCSAFYIENAISELLKKYDENLRAGDHINSKKLRDAGLTIFYRLCDMVDGDTDIYPPTKQLLSSCIDIVGKELVVKKGDQCYRILQLIIEYPRLVGLLIPIFCPSMTDAETFIRLYRRAITVYKTETVHLACMILSKFDMKTWFAVTGPSVSNRTELFQLIAFALTDLGADISEEFLILAELYYQHLTLLLHHQFPDMYREVLQFLFKGLTEDNLSEHVWYRVLRSLFQSYSLTSNWSLSIDSTEDEIVAICATFAENQDYFTLNQIKETLDWCGNSLMDLRASSKEMLYLTLYSKCHRNIKPVTIFLTAMNFSYISLIKRNGIRGVIPATMVDDLWHSIEHSFSALILPVTKNGEMWFPWVQEQKELAIKVMTCFVECISYAVTTLYASTNIMSHILKLYSNTYAKPNVSEHVMEACHHTLKNLPWNSFWPDMVAIDLMIQIIEQGLPGCLDFLCEIFFRISWPEVVRHVALAEYAKEAMPKVIGSLLQLHVCLGILPTACNQIETTTRMLTAATTYPWNLLDAEIYHIAIKYFTRSCTSEWVLEEKECPVLSLLQVAAEFVPGTQPIYPGVIKKRQLYADLVISLTCNSATNSKLLNSHSERFKEVITSLLNHTEAIVATSNHQETVLCESTVIAKSIMYVFKLTSIKRLQDITLKAVVDWVKAHPKCIILRGILSAASFSIDSKYYKADIIENLLETYFSTELDEDGIAHWSHLVSVIKVPVIEHNDLIAECKSRGLLLTVYAIAEQMLVSSLSVESKWKVAHQIMGWFNDNQFNLSEENDYKLILLWWKVLNGIVDSTNVKDATTIASSLVQFSSSVKFIGEDRYSQGLFSFLGLGKKSCLSYKMRFMARAVNAFILKQAHCFELKSVAENNSLKTLHIAKNAEFAEELLFTTTSNKPYELYKPLLELVGKFINKDDVLVMDYKQLFGCMITELFPDKNCLKFLVSTSH
ncbi:hypothetical protein CHUAL_000850 [Chamberlinius hualienensis]